MTLNQLILIYKDAAKRHYQINDFAAVQDFNIDSESDIKYPILVVNPVSANTPKSDNGYSSFETTFELQVVDLVNKDNNNRMDVLSDTQQIINDIVNEYATHPYYIDNSIDTINDIDYTPLRGVYSDDVDGWKTTIVLEHPNKVSFCGSPMEDLSGFDFSIKSGIHYGRPAPTGQTVSFRVGDDVWRESNMPYNKPPNNPLHRQELADFFTLKHNNAFGNKLRFTDINGNSTVVDNDTDTPDWMTDRYIIDHYTGLGWDYVRDESQNTKRDWDAAIDFCLASTAHGFDDWYLPNINELASVFNMEGNLFNINIMWMGGNRIQWTSTTKDNATTTAQYISSIFVASSNAKNVGWYFHKARQHY